MKTTHKACIYTQQNTRLQAAVMRLYIDQFHGVSIIGITDYFLQPETA